MTPLPFADFLEVLRLRGFGVGLKEHVAVGKLLDRWEGADRARVRDGIAALVARHEAEVRDIRALFDELYAERPRTAGVVPGEVTRPSWKVRAHALLQRRVAWAGALTVLASLVSLIVVVRTIDTVVLPAPPPAPQLFLATAAIAAPTSEAIHARVPTVVLGEPASTLPPPPRRVLWTPVLWAAGGVAIVAAAALWALRLRSAARDWARRAWRSVLADLPGPYEVELRLRDLVTRLPKADVEEAATIIGRAFSRDAQGRDLDVRATIRASVRAAHPRLVFSARRVQEPVLVLQDVAQTMDPHAARVDGLLDDLRRQGVLLERWYYDGDVSRPAPRPFTAPAALENVLRRRDTAPILVISAAEGLRASVEGADGAWLDALARADRRVWVTPVTDSRLWPAALLRVPLPVVPMTRRGLVEAASLLAHAERIGTGLTSRMIHHERRTTAADVDRLRRLASLVPFPTVSTLELLRQRFASDVPEAAIIHAVGGTTLGGDAPFRMPDEEIRELNAAMRRDDPGLEAQVREYLLRVLAESEPPAGSAAHLRWQASTAVQRLQIAHIEASDTTTPRDALRRLERGPLWEEVRASLARQPGEPAAPRRPQLVPSGDPPPFVARGAEPPPFAWRRPRLADLAVSLVLATVAGALVGFSPVARRTVSHRAGAYEVDYRLDGSAIGALSVRVREDAGVVPLTVQLYRDGRAFGAPLDIDPQVGARVPIDSSETAHVYQVRAPLSGGAIAASNSVWAPSTLVVINAQPWARVTIASVDGRVSAAETTPVAVRLPAGTYSMAFENGGLTPASSRQVRVTGPGPQLVEVPMDRAALEEAVKRLGGDVARPYSQGAKGQ